MSNTKGVGKWVAYTRCFRYPEAGAGSRWVLTVKESRVACRESAE